MTGTRARSRRARDMTVNGRSSRGVGEIRRIRIARGFLARPEKPPSPQTTHAAQPQAIVVMMRVAISGTTTVTTPGSSQASRRCSARIMNRVTTVPQWDS